MKNYVSGYENWIDDVWAKLDRKLSKIAIRSREKLPYTSINGVHDDMQKKDVTWWTNGFLGGMILVSGDPVAISFGEIIGDTFFIHIEKASRTVRGSYQMMLSEFVTHYADESVLYVNREEDVGDPGLRYSKEAYHPERLLAKYIVE